MSSRSGVVGGPVRPPRAKSFVAKPAFKRVIAAEGQSYNKVGRNALFEARPSVLHFGGYEVGNVHEMTVKVVNISTTSQRLKLIEPNTPYFRIKCDKKGLIAPGMAEVVVVEFMPTEWRYYYDCVRVYSDKENMMIPIHAYPKPNEASFPRRIDLGTCPLADTTTRVINFSCSVPIQFEYKLTVVRPHPDITISPLAGTIPAKGSSPITIAFRPCKMSVARAELVVSLSQFGFEPYTVSIVGSATPGAERDRVLAAPELDDDTLRFTDGDGAGATAGHGSLTLSASRGPPTAGLTSTIPVPPPKIKQHGSGAGGRYRDPGVAVAEEAWRKGATRRLAASKRTTDGAASGEIDTGAETGAKEKTIRGIRIPKDLASTRAVTFVLTQEKGKLKPKDLKAAIVAQNRTRAAQKEAQAKIRAARAAVSGADISAIKTAAGVGLSVDDLTGEERGVADVDVGFSDSEEEEAAREEGHVPATAPDEDPEAVRRLKEMIFLQDIADIEKAEREREFQGDGSWLGEDLMVEEEVEAVIDARRETAESKALAERRGARRRHFCEARGPWQIPPSRATVTAHAPPPRNPTFDSYGNDLWRMRKQVLLKLRRIATSAIIRRRADARLASLRRKVAETLEAASRQGGVRSVVEREFRAAQTKGGSSGEAPWIPESFVVSGPPAVRRITFPVSSADEDDDGSGGSNKDPVLVETPHAFPELSGFKLAEAPHMKVMAYKKMDVPAAPLYIPTGEGRNIRLGAQAESTIRVANPSLDERLSSAASACEMAPPRTVLPPPPPLPSLDPLLPDPGIRPIPAFEANTETSPGYMLQVSVTDKFSVAPPTLPPPRIGLHEPADSRPAEATLDVNGLLLSRGEVESTTPGMSSLRALLPVPFLSNSWRPRRERPMPDPGLGLHPTVPLPSCDPWVPTAAPTLLAGPLKDDELSDDSESDEEDPDPLPPPSLRRAQTMFMDSKDDDGKEEGEEAKEPPRPLTGRPPIVRVAIPRDRALLALAERERAESTGAAGWLDRATKHVNRDIVDPKHKFVYVEVEPPPGSALEPSDC